MMNNFIDILIEPLQYSFMIRGMMAAVMVGIVCALVGTFIVLRGMAFFGDALAHAILPGIAVGYLISGGARQPIFWWSLATAVVSSLSIGAISRSTKIKEDTAIGIVFAGMFALGIALISTTRNYTIDLAHFLFGDILGVSNHDLLLNGIFGGLVVMGIVLFYKEFLVMSFDPVLAFTLRLPKLVLESLLLILIAIAIVTSLQAVGIALVVAMLVTPSATAFMLTKRLPIMLILAVILASFSGVAGLYLSYYLNIASGSSIVLFSTGLFVIVWFSKLMTSKIKGYEL